MNYFQNYNVNNFFDDLARGLQAILTDKALILFGLAGAGFVRVFLQDADITLDFAFATFMAFGIMSVFGLIKHVKSGEHNPKIFLIKTGIQLCIMLGAILLGYCFAIVIFGVNKIAGVIGIVEQPMRPKAGMYFIYAAYMIAFCYHSLKAIELANFVLPGFFPEWFSAPFKRFSKSGQFADLLKSPPPVEESKKPAQDPVE